jgi:lipopolysaccharide biosynthesis protein
MRRVAAFAHYDPQNAIKGYILHHLRALREVCDEIHFASTAQLADAELAKLEGIVTSRRLFENSGYDFKMWAEITNSLDLGKWDELVLTNSSVFGPITPLARAFERMESVACDFWGMTDSLEIEYHVQSFFLVFRKSMLAGGAVRQFFASVLPYRHKLQAIRSYELGLSHFFLDQGFVPAALASVLDRSLSLGACNPCLRASIRLMELGMPYVKVELLRDNPFALRLAPIRARMASAGYPLDLVEVDRRPRESFVLDLWNRVDLQLRRWGLRGPAVVPLRPALAAALKRSQPPGEKP